MRGGFNLENLKKRLKELVYKSPLPFNHDQLFNWLIVNKKALKEIINDPDFNNIGKVYWDDNIKHREGYYDE